MIQVQCLPGKTPKPQLLSDEKDLPGFVSVVANQQILVALDCNGEVWKNDFPFNTISFKKEEDTEGTTSIFVPTYRNYMGIPTPILFLLDYEGVIWLYSEGKKEVIHEGICKFSSFSLSNISAGVDYDGQVWVWYGDGERIIIKKLD